MINTTEQQRSPGAPMVIVTGDSIAEIVEYMRNRIRPQSQDFYLREIPECLGKHGEDIVDMHAAGGRMHKLILRNE